MLRFRIIGRGKQRVSKSMAISVDTVAIKIVAKFNVRFPMPVHCVETGSVENMELCDLPLAKKSL